MSFKKIILASASPRRKQLLEQAEIDFEIIVSNTDESFDPDMDLHEIPQFIALQKAIAVREKIISREPIIIAADTIVVLNNEIIGKPKDSEDAKNILHKLAGQMHRVITGVVVIKGEETIQFCDTTEVQFHPLSATQIEHYVTNYKPFDKAGAYAIQEWIGVIGIQSIRGCFYNVMGLPVSKLLPHL
jgi:septum formation protein